MLVNCEVPLASLKWHVFTQANGPSALSYLVLHSIVKIPWGGEHEIFLCSNTMPASHLFPLVSLIVCLHWHEHCMAVLLVCTDWLWGSTIYFPATPASEIPRLNLGGWYIQAKWDSLQIHLECGSQSSHPPPATETDRLWDLFSLWAE